MGFEDPKKDYHVTIVSKYACPNGKVPDNCGSTSSSSSSSGDSTSTTGSTGGGKKHKGGHAFDFGWVFIIIVAVFIVLYIPVGFAINRFYLKKQGMEQFPNWLFWRALPGLVWDGHLFIYRSLRGLCGERHDRF